MSPRAMPNERPPPPVYEPDPFPEEEPPTRPSTPSSLALGPYREGGRPSPVTVEVPPSRPPSPALRALLEPYRPPPAPERPATESWGRALLRLLLGL